ncbi:unnamed protein product [Ambrosiozyma monospora]|uniref:Unnamed protein product n=1 Tax=Ambrosiozyma monospora TaxID=43982 RepID=A0ACB5TAV0_AMBMO|nr:unnamed protein product [Ambrosiozyma monospora]
MSINYNNNNNNHTNDNNALNENPSLDELLRTIAIFNSLKTIVLSNELSLLNTKSDHFEVYFLMSMMRPEDACTHSQYASSVNFLNIIIIASRSIVHSNQSNSNALVSVTDVPDEMEAWNDSYDPETCLLKVSVEPMGFESRMDVHHEPTTTEASASGTTSFTSSPTDFVTQTCHSNSSFVFCQERLKKYQSTSELSSHLFQDSLPVQITDDDSFSHCIVLSSDMNCKVLAQRLKEVLNTFQPAPNFVLDTGILEMKDTSCPSLRFPNHVLRSLYCSSTTVQIAENNDFSIDLDTEFVKNKRLLVNQLRKFHELHRTLANNHAIEMSLDNTK